MKNLWKAEFRSGGIFSTVQLAELLEGAAKETWNIEWSKSYEKSYKG